MCKGKCVQHILPQIDLPENFSVPETRSPNGFMGTNKQSVAGIIIIKQNLDNDEDGPFRLIIDPEEHISSDNKDFNDETDLRSYKRKKDTKKDDNNKKKTCKFIVIKYVTNGDFSSNVENDMKWIEDIINQVIYITAKKVKYPSDEFIMQISYDALINAENDNFNKKMKNGSSWKRFFNKHIRKIAQRFCQQACSNIVQHIKDAVHAEFMDLKKPKTKNHQIICEAEKKFKDSKITQKNSIAFSMTVTLNYLDPLKGINIVPSEVIERMNNFLEKMNVINCEKLD
ncbi:hypothetical protein C1646_772239 [Rhizophagus diaphanus]|nr:hypothetical protein C1646_772239 [Rhizophagus diaphanus] [Rhizophagus sp. MUCL 43196]